MFQKREKYYTSKINSDNDEGYALNKTVDKVERTKVVL